jgi:hypothetical protein
MAISGGARLVVAFCCTLLMACSINPASYTPLGDGGGAPHPDPDAGVADPGPGSGTIVDAPSTPQAMATLTIERSGPELGIVSAPGTALACGTTCSVRVPVGTQISLQATPATGGAFAGWTGCGSETATCTLTVTDDVTVGARFEVAMFTVILEASGLGSGQLFPPPGTGPGSGAGCRDACSITVPFGFSFDVSASASSGSTFTGWTSGPCSGSTSTTCSFSVTQDVTVIGNFIADNSLNIDLIDNGNGRVTSTPGQIDCPGTCADTFAPGTQVTLTAQADADSLFEGWQGACSGTEPCVVTMDTAKSVRAQFHLQDRALRIEIAGPGAGQVNVEPSGISCESPCDVSGPIHSVITLTATPIDGSIFTGWSSPCSGTGSCTITLDDDVVVTASFAPPPPPSTRTLHIQKAGDGSGDVSNSFGTSCGASCDLVFPAGTQLTLTATPSPDSSLAGWDLPACGTDTDCPITLTDDLTITATFAIAPPVKVVINFVGPGRIIGDGNTGTCTRPPGTAACLLFAVGSIATFNVQVSPGVVFTGWQDACQAFGTNEQCTLQITNRTAATLSVFADFARTP